MSDGQQPSQAAHRRAEYSTGFRACTFYLVFKEPARGSVFCLVEPCARQLQANSPRIPSFPSPCQHLFSVSFPAPDFGTGQIDPSRQLATPQNLRYRTASPWGLGPRGLAGLGCRLPGACETLTASARSFTEHPGRRGRAVGDAGAPGKTFEISGSPSKCQPRNFSIHLMWPRRPESLSRNPWRRAVLTA